MIRCSIEPRDVMFAISFGFLSFAKHIGTKIGKNINKN